MIREDERVAIDRATRCKACFHSSLLHDYGDEGYGAHCNVPECECTTAIGGFFVDDDVEIPNDDPRAVG